MIVDSITTHCGQSETVSVASSPPHTSCSSWICSKRQGTVLLRTSCPLPVRRSTSDPIIVHTVFDIARVHDSLDSLSPEDERRRSPFLPVCEQIDFGNDVEQQLKLLVDCARRFRTLTRSRIGLCSLWQTMIKHTYERAPDTQNTAFVSMPCLRIYDSFN